MTDEKIIEMLNKRKQGAVCELSQKYGRLCRGIAFGILASPEDAAECENDAYLRVWLSIPPQHPKNLRAYICRIVRNIALDRIKAANRKKRSAELDLLLSELDECIPDNDSVEESADSTVRDCITDFLSSQSYEARKMFVRRYFYGQSVKEIAKAMSVTQTSVTTKLCRIRKKLKEHLQADGISV